MGLMNKTRTFADVEEVIDNSRAAKANLEKYNLELEDFIKRRHSYHEQVCHNGSSFVVENEHVFPVPGSTTKGGEESENK